MANLVSNDQTGPLASCYSNKYPNFTTLQAAPTLHTHFHTHSHTHTHTRTGCAHTASKTQRCAWPALVNHWDGSQQSVRPEQLSQIRSSMILQSPNPFLDPCPSQNYSSLSPHLRHTFQSQAAGSHRKTATDYTVLAAG